MLKSIYTLVTALFLVSCATYSPKPLTDSEVNKALGMPIQSISQNQLKPVPIDFSKPLTIQQIALITVITNPDLKALRAKNDIASAQVFDAGLLPDPQIMPAYEIPTTSGNGVTPAYSLWVNWDIGSLVTRSLKESAAKELQKQVSYSTAWQEWMIANQAELLATRVYYLQEQARLIQQSNIISKNYLNELQANLEQHNIKIDYFNQEKATYLDLVNQQQTIERLLAKTKLELTQVMGLPPTASIQLQINPNITIPKLNESELFAYARQNRLDVLALKAGYNNQEIQVRQAVLGQYPHFTTSIYPGQDNTSNGFFGTNVAFDIPVFNRNRGAIAIATATRENLYLEYIARLHNIQYNIYSVSKELNWATEQEKALNSEMPQLRNTDNRLKQELLNLNISLSNYTSFHNTLLTKELKLLSVQQDIAEQGVAMQMALGKYLDGRINEIK